MPLLNECMNGQEVVCLGIHHVRGYPPDVPDYQAEFVHAVQAVLNSRQGHTGEKAYLLNRNRVKSAHSQLDALQHSKVLFLHFWKDAEGRKAHGRITNRRVCWRLYLSRV